MLLEYGTTDDGTEPNMFYLIYFINTYQYKPMYIDGNGDPTLK